MSEPRGLLAELERLIAEAPAEELPALIGRLRAAELAAELRLRSAPTRSAGCAVEREASARWLTPAEAATLASVPVKRIYEWARGKRWASRPTRRCLRIDEASFRRWLATH